MANYQLTRLAHRSGRKLHLQQLGIALCIVVLLSLAACSEQPAASAIDQQAKQRDHAGELHLDLGPLQNLVNAQSRKSIIFAEALRLSIERFLQTPDDTQHAQVQEAWLKAHSAYADLSSLPLPALVTVDSDIRLAAEHLLYQLDAWPIEPGYLDFLPAYPGSGLISDITVPMTPASMREQHGFTDVQEVSMGFHALEYLLFARGLQEFQIADYSVPDRQNDLKNEHIRALQRVIILRRKDALRIIAEQINLDLASLFAMNGAGYTGLDNDNMGGEKRAVLGLTLSIVQHLRQVALHAIDDNERLMTGDVGHGEYSATRQRLLAAALGSLQLTLFEPVNLTALVATNGTDTVDTLRKTLQEAKNNAGGKTTTADDSARLALLLAALPHLLDDLARLISLTPKQQH